jgi:hypothetical protein
MTDQQRPPLGEFAGYWRKTWWPYLALWGVCFVALGVFFGRHLRAVSRHYRAAQLQVKAKSKTSKA